MTTTQLLSSYGVTMQQAYQFVVSNLNNPQNIITTCKQAGITNAMLAEIVGTGIPGVTANDVKNFFVSNGLDSTQLDTSTADAPATPTLPTTVTNSNTGIVFQIVVGTPGNDVFNHTSGNKIYFGMGGNDMFSNSTYSRVLLNLLAGKGMIRITSRLAV